MFDPELIVSLIDLTALGDQETTASTQALCEAAITKLGHVAAVCLWPQFVAQAKVLLDGSGVKVATVVNFPRGDGVLQAVLSDVEMVLQEGADEVDLVIPYRDYLSMGKSDNTIALVKACKTLCLDKKLKVIIESGALEDPVLIRRVSEDVVMAGADFIKTSTGKIPVGATIEAAEVMLTVIAEQVDRQVGFKASGGIRTYEQACEYLQLAQELCGVGFLNRQTFRFGASGLLQNVLSLN